MSYFSSYTVRYMWCVVSHILAMQNTAKQRWSKTEAKQTKPGFETIHWNTRVNWRDLM